MAKDNGNNKGLTNIEFWEQPFENEPFYNNVEQMLANTGISDMAGNFARGNFISDRRKKAAVRLSRRHRKFHLDDQQQTLLEALNADVGMRAFGKLLQLQAATYLGMPTVLREALGMKTVKNENEAVYRGSDFRRHKAESNNELPDGIR